MAFDVTANLHPTRPQPAGLRLLNPQERRAAKMAGEGAGLTEIAAVTGLTGHKIREAVVLQAKWRRQPPPLGWQPEPEADPDAPVPAGERSIPAPARREPRPAPPRQFVEHASSVLPPTGDVRYATAVRAWARRNGFDVADRGRIKQHVIDAFTAAQAAATP